MLNIFLVSEKILCDHSLSDRPGPSNKLLYLDDSVDGMKTGFTKKAGYCLVSSAKRGKRRLIAVVMGAKNPDLRTSASKSLLEYGFRFFETHKIYNQNETVSQARLFDGETVSYTHLTLPTKA